MMIFANRQTGLMPVDIAKVLSKKKKKIVQ